MKDNKELLLTVYIIIAYSIFSFMLTEFIKESLIEFIVTMSKEELEIPGPYDVQLSSSVNRNEVVEPHETSPRIERGNNKIVDDDRPIDIPEF